jgi:hypothetical protein
LGLLGAVLLVTAAWGAPPGPGLVEHRLEEQATEAMNRARDPSWIQGDGEATLREAVDRLLALGYHQVRHGRYDAGAESFLEARFLVAERAAASELALRCRNQGETELLVQALGDHQELHRRVRPGALVERAALAAELGAQFRILGDIERRRLALEEAVTLTREAEGPASGRLALLELDLAEALLDSGEKAAAARILERLRARESVGAQAFGGTHPVVNPRITQGLERSREP